MQNRIQYGGNVKSMSSNKYFEDDLWWHDFKSAARKLLQGTDDLSELHSMRREMISVIWNITDDLQDNFTYDVLEGGK